MSENDGEQNAIGKNVPRRNGTNCRNVKKMIHCPNETCYKCSIFGLILIYRDTKNILVHHLASLLFKTAPGLESKDVDLSLVRINLAKSFITCQLLLLPIQRSTLMNIVSVLNAMILATSNFWLVSLYIRIDCIIWNYILLFQNLLPKVSFKK